MKGKHAVRRTSIKARDLRSTCDERPNHVPMEAVKTIVPVETPLGWVDGFRSVCLHCQKLIETHNEDLNRYGSMIWRVQEYIIEEVPW